MFSTLPKTNFYFSVTFILSSANAFNLEQSKILSFGKGLNLSKMPRFFCARLENTVGKGEDAGNQNFHLVSNCFLKVFVVGWIVKS